MHAPIPKRDVQLFKPVPLLTKIRVDITIICQFPPSVSRPFTSDKMGERTTSCLCLLSSQLIRSVFEFCCLCARAAYPAAAGSAWPNAKYQSARFILTRATQKERDGALLVSYCFLVFDW